MFYTKSTWAHKQNIYLLNWIIYLYIPKHFAKKCVISKPQRVELLPKALVIALCRDRAECEESCTVGVWLHYGQWRVVLGALAFGTSLFAFESHLSFSTCQSCPLGNLLNFFMSQIVIYKLGLAVILTSRVLRIKDKYVLYLDSVWHKLYYIKCML